MLCFKEFGRRKIFSKKRISILWSFFTSHNVVLNNSHVISARNLCKDLGKFACFGTFERKWACLTLKNRELLYISTHPNVHIWRKMAKIQFSVSQDFALANKKKIASKYFVKDSVMRFLPLYFFFFFNLTQYGPLLHIIKCSSICFRFRAEKLENSDAAESCSTVYFDTAESSTALSVIK